MMIPWTRLDQNSPIVFWAYMKLSENQKAGCHYHNGDHVVAMYKYLSDTNEPYNEVLDWAVLFHDIVYDDKPNKEYRSAIMFSDMKEKYSGCDLNILNEGTVAAMIMATENHCVAYKINSAIIRADLHGLSNRATAFKNFSKIMEESMVLYGIDEITFANNSEQFMRGLYERVWSNLTSDPEHAAFYHEVINGIWFTIDLAKLMQGTL